MKLLQLTVLLEMFGEEHEVRNNISHVPTKQKGTNWLQHNNNPKKGAAVPFVLSDDDTHLELGVAVLVLFRFKLMAKN